MTEDARCCGTGTCIINEEGFCWCGQRWDGMKMCFPQTEENANSEVEESNQPLSSKSPSRF